MYGDGDIYTDSFPEDKTRTWDYSPHFDSIYSDAEYAKLYCNGKSLSQMTPESMREEFLKVASEHQNHIQAAKSAKIDLSKIDLYEIVPPSITKSFYGTSEKVLRYIFETQEKPYNYETLDSVNKIIKNIQHNSLCIDRDFLMDFRPKNHLESSFIRRMLTEDLRIKYDIFGTITGRMTTDKSGLSIMTMPKELRTAILPKNDFLVEIDYNAAELRVALSLLGYSQPSEDIHDWNMKKVFKDTTDRSEAKKKIFSWLYNSNSKNEEIEKIYDRQAILEKFYAAGQIKNFFGREIKCEPKVALNYIIQSTAADMFSRQLSKIGKTLEGKRTNILYTMHDSIVLDFAHEDRPHLSTILENFSSTDLGEFVVNISVGERYDQLKGRRWIK